MTVSTLFNMTWEEVRDLDRDRTLAILPIGAVEAHGPHLPLGTDGIIADAMADAGGRRLAEKGWHVVVLPRLDYTPAGFASAFPGTVSTSVDGLRDAIVGVASEVARHGFGPVIVANAHFDPANLAAIHGAVGMCGARDVRIVFPDLTRKPWALRLTDEFKSGACHAGRYEGSIVLAARPDLVRADIQAELPDNPSSLSTAIRDGRTTFEAAGGDRAYFGYPAEATAEEGQETIEILGAILEEATLAALGEDQP